MSDELVRKLLTGSAYRIFHEELQKHIAATQTVFDADRLDEKSIKDAAARFHTIRGGAGFFKLTALGNLAGQLEDLLDDTPLADLQGRVEDLRGLYKQLLDEANLAPVPTSSGV